ncbi:MULTISPECIES: alpha/beta fold hydrolase [Ralstonia solanacearum species complex]|uniref:alpha/beta fold hydrolase n=1 Tax=Ralstonia solanacearum species complex TaxID=3116862 RepID=UPI000E578C34|nr:alpha/beta hydrolase [Ralstonia solanacearum]AXV93747.1 alpha/beta hydrolase [Ralstonia solanacearum]AXW21746.1 alpha/beta hydrolase [Ralstonia solanacearum]AXW78642.1 alpha/beta hydrolase [Ralstonia solanacearum]
MPGSFIDSLLTRISRIHLKRQGGEVLPTFQVNTAVGAVRVYDSGSTKPCVVFVPDGPNVIEHYEVLIGLLVPRFRVVCFDMPGFGFSLPRPSYKHSLVQGANAVLGVLDGLGIRTAALAFSCANGFYALQTALMAPERITNLVLSQTPSLTAMHAWAYRTIPRPLRIPVIGQVAAWLFRRQAAHRWYGRALPRTTDAQCFRKTAHHALSSGGCFCLAGVVQGLIREKAEPLKAIQTPCTIIWGTRDDSHRDTNPTSLREYIPQAEMIRFDDCGHFPDIEQPERYASVLIERIARHT